MYHVSIIYVPCQHHICTMSASYMYHVSTIYVPCQHHICTMSAPYMYHVSIIYVPCQHHICAMSAPYMCHVSTIYVPRQHHICTTSASYMYHVSIIYAPCQHHICTMSASYMYHVSIIYVPCQHHICIMSSLIYASIFKYTCIFIIHPDTLHYILEVCVLHIDIHLELVVTQTTQFSIEVANHVIYAVQDSVSLIDEPKKSFQKFQVPVSNILFLLSL